MQKNRNKKIIGITIAISIIIIVALLDFYSFFDFPKEICIIEGKEQTLELDIPLTFQLLCDNKENIKINGDFLSNKPKINLKEPLTLQSSKLGIYELEFRLLGVLPIKKMKVHVMPEKRVVPGGHSVGVKLRPNGVIVVGFAPIVDEKGQKHSPAQESGIKIGDTIYKVNDKNIYSAEDLSKIINSCPENIDDINVKRNGKKISIKLNPIKNNVGIYQLGLWVRDVTAGVGTLTFYDPETGYYGALGHIISDADTGKVIEVGRGEIIRAKITSISHGKKNQPGEKKGVFINEQQTMGNITANTPFGIFGKTYYELNNPYYSTLPIAPVSQVHEGKAKILTVVKDEKIQQYDIEIQKITQQSFPNSKGMIIKITDSDLLDKTGGIVQGMSGSPIIQDECLIGAVTHVFVNDPTKGYGVFAEWMMDQIEEVKNHRTLVNY